MKWSINCTGSSGDTVFVSDHTRKQLRGGKVLLGRHFQATVHCSGKSGEGLEAETMEEHLSCTGQDLLPRDGAAHSGQCLPISISNRHVHWPI